MTWDQIATDPFTYAALYILSVLLAIPTTKHAFAEKAKRSHCFDTNAKEGAYAGAVFAVIGGPITLFVYWVIIFFAVRAWKRAAEHLLPKEYHFTEKDK